MKTTTEKQHLTFMIDDRQVKGIYVDMNGNLVQIRVTEDSQGLFNEGDHTNIHRHFLTELEDQAYIETQEYNKLNLAQKWFGKYYLGLVILLIASGAIIWAYNT